MKKIVALILSLFAITASSRAIGMQAPEHADTQNITFDNPHKLVDETENTFLEINALIGNKKVGHIHYQLSEPGVWYIKELKVNPEHRNKSEKRVGSKLFSHLLKRICTRNPQRIYWHVSEIEEENSPSLKVLNQIYIQMLAKITLPSYQFSREDYETITIMTLEFNQKNNGDL